MLVQHEAWVKRGACHGLAADLGARERDRIFYPERGASVEHARAICATCPVIEECLEYALVHREKWGIWGGTSERERRKMRAERIAAGTLDPYEKPIEHGTHAGHAGHVRRGEEPCGPCRWAHNEYVALMRAEQRERRAS